MAERQFFTVPEFAETMRVSKQHIYKMVSDGEVRAVRVGARIVIPDSEIDRLLEEAGKAAS